MRPALSRKATARLGAAPVQWTAGRIENSQISVFLAYAAAQGTALIDRARRTRKAGPMPRCQPHIPDEVAFATKPKMALQMLQEPWCTMCPLVR